MRFDNEQLKTSAKLIAYDVSKIFGDGSQDEADSNVEVW